MSHWISERSGNERNAHIATVNIVFSGFRESEVYITPADLENYGQSRGLSVASQCDRTFGSDR